LIDLEAEHDEFELLGGAQPAYSRDARGAHASGMGVTCRFTTVPRERHASRR
jgi:hypothetical protein